MTIPQKAKKLLEQGEVYLGTTDGQWPNVTLTESGVIVGQDKLLISDCEMTLAKDNILKNGLCSLVVYNSKTGQGYKAFGHAKYYDQGKFLKIAQKRLAGSPYKARGAVVIDIDKIWSIA